MAAPLKLRGPAAGKLAAAIALNAPHQRAKNGQLRKGHVLRNRVLPKRHAPLALEAEYASELIRSIAAVKDSLAPLMREMPTLLESARSSRGDAMETVERIGLKILIECPAGSKREWTDANGNTGFTEMKFDYGEIVGYLGMDGDAVDVFLGPEIEPSHVYVIDQMKKSEDFAVLDEQKVMLGWSGPNDAMAAYIDQYGDPRFFGGMHAFTVDDFKAKLRASDGEQMTHARTDSNEPKRALALVAAARDKMRRESWGKKIDDLADRTAQNVSRFQQQQFNKQTKAALGVDIASSDRRIPALLTHFSAENVQLITSLHARTFDDVGKLVTRAFTSGTRPETLAKDLQDRFDISERHARFIARDQINKLAAQVDQSRMQEIGINRYIWRTMEDERVRPEHQALDGEMFNFDEGSGEEGNPGDEPGCRCFPEPVWNDILQPDNPGPDGSSDEDADS